MALMSASTTLADTDWLGACRRASDGLAAVLRDTPTSPQRVLETGERGGGGDRTLIIDSQAEEVVFAQLQRLHDDGARFTAISEERGTVDFGDPDVIVIIDPIDGSMNAKRGLPSHALSIAVADGPTMADVVFGYVHDLGPGEEWRATRGEGAYLDDAPIVAPPERHTSAGLMELVAIEAADPRWVAASADELVAVAHRLRAIGSIAIAMCQVAATRVDGMVTLRRCRGVDAAAAQLIVRESGGVVAFGGGEDPLAAPLDLAPFAPAAAARTPQSLERLIRVPAL
jgi:myo-inositol-1(or 4)-monophosphatase